MDIETFYVSLFGSPYVGKSSFAFKLALGLFFNGYDPAREESYVKHLSIGGKYCILALIDTDSHDTSLIKRGQWIYKSDATMLVYSVSSRESFKQLESFWKVTKAVKTQIGMWEPFQLCVIGNKCDLEEKREVSFEEGQAFAQKIECAFKEVSSKTGEGVDSAAYDLVRRVKTYRDNERIRYEQLQEQTKLEREKRARRLQIWRKILLK